MVPLSSPVLCACSYAHKMRARLAFAMLGMLAQFVCRSRIARGHGHCVHSCTVARSCPSVRVLGADGAIVLILCLRGMQLLA
eukprot:6091474-Alexandrium_andersonii.AAC.1